MVSDTPISYIFSHVHATFISLSVRRVRPHPCPCPPARDWCSRVYGLVLDRSRTPLREYINIYINMYRKCFRDPFTTAAVNYLLVCAAFQTHNHNFTSQFFWHSYLLSPHSSFLSLFWVTAPSGGEFLYNGEKFPMYVHPSVRILFPPRSSQPGLRASQSGLGPSQIDGRTDRWMEREGLTDRLSCHYFIFHNWSRNILFYFVATRGVDPVVDICPKCQKE